MDALQFPSAADGAGALSTNSLPAPLSDQVIPNNNARYRSLELPEDDQKKLVDMCREFKRNANQAFKTKHQDMERAYAYYKMKFLGRGNDLLPIVGAEGDERSIESDRPKIFLPVVRQIVIQLYSQIKLALFPQDEGYFRIKGKNEKAAEKEDELTEAFETLLQDMQFTEKEGRNLLNACIFGSKVGYPCVDVEVGYEWIINEITNQYEMVEKPQPPKLDLKIFNPMNFIPDPSESFSDRSKWVYMDSRKKQCLLDSELYFNKDKLREHKKSKETDKGKADNNKRNLLNYNGLSNSFKDIEDHIDYDLYYLPYVSLSTGEYRNMLVGIVEDEILVRFFPNLAPGGKNPVVYCDWRPDPVSPLGDGPAEDIAELQRMINMIENYKLESLARNGNRWSVPFGTDVGSLFNLAGGVTYHDPTSGPPVPLSGNMAEYGALQNEIGIMKAEAQITTGANQPFQGASNVDFKKTATELQIINEGALTVMREVVEHAAVVGLKRTLEMLMHLAATVYKGTKIEVRSEDEDGEPDFKMVDISVLASGDYEIEITSVNPSMSKQAQIELLTNIYNEAMKNPAVLAMLKANGWHLMKLILQLAGIKNMEFAKAPSEVRMGMAMGPGMVDPMMGGVANGGQTV